MLLFSLHVYEIATFLLQLICVCLLADLLVDCSSVVNVSQYISFLSSQRHFQEPALLSVNTLALEFIFSMLVSLHFLLVLTMRVCLMSKLLGLPVISFSIMILMDYSAVIL